MKKVQKGDPGYLDHKKRIEIIRTIIYFGDRSGCLSAWLQSDAHTAKYSDSGGGFWVVCRRQKHWWE